MPSPRHRVVLPTYAVVLLTVTGAHCRSAPSLGAVESKAAPLIADLQTLSDSIGGRPTGSPALDRAVQWALATFAAAGAENVHAEDYVAPGIWLPGGEAGEVTAPRATGPGANVLRVAAMPFSGPTPAGGLEAEVIDVGPGDAGALAAAGSKARGRWLLVHRDPMNSIEDLDAEYAATPPLFAAAHAVGAVGVLWMSTRPGRLLYRHNVSFAGTLDVLPGAVVEREGALRLEELLRSNQTVHVRLQLRGAYARDAKARNVVAEVRGRDKAADTIILGAHLDSWDLGRGALDDGCNAALTIDVARHILQLAMGGRRPRRTVRFVLYTGEEDGFWGSWADVRQHRGDLDRVKAMIELDLGSGKVTGFSLGGRDDLRAAVDRALLPVASWGPFSQTTDAFVGSDNYDYLLEGVPTLVANQDGTSYVPHYHAESDTFDKVDTAQLTANSAIVAALVWELADMEADPAPRQTRTEVEALLKATGLDRQMQLYGLWDAFASGARGRAVSVR